MAPDTFNAFAASLVSSSSRRLASTLVALVALATPALATSPVATAAATDAATKELYAAQCQACHMSDGKAAIPEMNLADGKWLHGTTVAALTKVISDGVPGKAMLPFKDRLTPQQIDALARYVRTFDKTLKPAPKAAPKAGAKTATPAPKTQAKTSAPGATVPAAYDGSR